MPKVLTEWTEDRIEFVRIHVEKGYSRAQVAEMLGGTTRNAVIGITNRHGIRYDKPMGLPKPKRIRIRPKKPQNVSIFATRWGASDPDRKPPNSIEVANVVANPLHILFDQLSRKNCHWPYGDGPFTFCGCEATSSGPYCEAHTLQSMEKKARSARLERLADLEMAA